jgi:hypothetical protein
LRLLILKPDSSLPASARGGVFGSWDVHAGVVAWREEPVQDLLGRGPSEKLGDVAAALGSVLPSRDSCSPIWQQRQQEAEGA